MTKHYRSQVLASIHETAVGLHAAGAIDQAVMRNFEEACLTAVGASLGLPSLRIDELVERH